MPTDPPAERYDDSCQVLRSQAEIDRWCAELAEKRAELDRLAGVIEQIRAQVGFWESAPPGYKKPWRSVVAEVRALLPSPTDGSDE